MKDVFISKVGIYGYMHYQYLIENNSFVINVLRTKGTLWQYLEEVKANAEEMLTQLEAEMANSEGVI